MIHYTLKTPRIKPIAASRRVGDAGCPDAGWQRLTNKQKGKLSMLAAKAFAHQKVQGMTATEWRHEIAISTCGVRISEAIQDHYNDLKSAFQDLAGYHAAAFRTQVRSPDNKRRIAMHKLVSACKERGLNESYPASICFDQFKCSLADASAKQLWCLFFTVTKRRNAQAGNALAQTPPDSGTKNHE